MDLAEVSIGKQQVSASNDGGDRILEVVLAEARHMLAQLRRFSHSEGSLPYLPLVGRSGAAGASLKLRPSKTSPSWGDPARFCALGWRVPALKRGSHVIPAKAGIQKRHALRS